GSAIEASDGKRITTVEPNCKLDLRQVHQSVPTRCGRQGQGNDDVAIQQSSKKQRTRARRIVATDCQCVSRLDPLSRQIGERGTRTIIKLVKRPSIVAPYDGGSLPPRFHALSQPITFHRARS